MAKRPSLAIESSPADAIPSRADRRAQSIATLKEQLLKKKQELLGAVRGSALVLQATKEPGLGDWADGGSTDANFSVAIGLMGTSQRILDQVASALEAMEDGNYGDCTKCQSPIPLARLQAIPFTQHCKDCQEKEDGGQG